MATLSKDGAAEGTTVIARQQTAGRGRLGREWVSAPDSGLYLSTLLRPEAALGELPVITLCLGVAARRAVMAISSVDLGLKWVNDLIYNTKKAGGILVEMPVTGSKTTASKALIVGIGINLKKPPGELPEQIREKAIYLNQITEQEIDPAKLAAELCFQIEEIYTKMKRNELSLILDEWRAGSVTLGQEITTINHDISGTALDISDTGALIVKTDKGNKVLNAGEISIRSSCGSYSY